MVKCGASRSASCVIPWSKARYCKAPSTRMTTGPLPDWSNAMVVPSFEVTVFIRNSPLLYNAESKVRHARGFDHADDFQGSGSYIQVIEQPDTFPKQEGCHIDVDLVH